MKRPGGCYPDVVAMRQVDPSIAETSRNRRRFGDGRRRKHSARVSWPGSYGDRFAFMGLSP
jgi:hypothetical protein